MVSLYGQMNAFETEMLKIAGLCLIDELDWKIFALNVEEHDFDCMEFVTD